jgi:hypothetical protein
MLISHQHKFIFTKTKKTASTTVSDFFTRYCVESSYTSTDSVDEQVNELGVVGRRVLGKYTSKHKFDVNTTPRKIRMFLGSETFDDYVKFTVIRNPFDRAISIFYFVKNIENNLRYIIDPRWRFKFEISENDSDIDLFKRWVTRYENSPQNYLTDRKMYTIDNEMCMDYLIRFENLEEGIRKVCDRVSIQFVPEYIQKFKSHYRKRIHYTEFYSDREIQIMTNVLKYELEEFNYKFGD